MPGKLILVPTPVGNLEDITLRAIRIMREADIILAEDTRVSGFLLKHLGIEKKITSHHKFNEHKTLNGLVSKIEEGNTVALLSDAGTPGISDPGFLLVRACVEKNLEVECLPGPTALIPALVISGLPTEPFHFEGFLPQKKGRQTKLKQLAGLEHTIILYESPFRLLKTLEQLKEFFGENRKASVSRELSKKFEETRRGTIAELAESFKNEQVKGEIVIIVGGKEKEPKSELRD